MPFGGLGSLRLAVQARRWWCALVAVVLAFACLACGRAEERVSRVAVDGSTDVALEIRDAEVVQARYSVSVLRDPTGVLDFEAARKSSDWQTPGSDPRFHISDAAGWVRLRVVNHSDSSELVAWQGHPWPMTLDAYLPSGKVAHLVGTEVPSTHPRTGFTMRFVLPPGNSETLYFRYAGRLQAPTLVVGPEAAFNESYAISNLAHGAFYGVLLALMLYNLVLWAILKSHAYGYYVAHVGVTLWYFLGRNMHVAEAPWLRPVAGLMAPNPRFWTVAMLWISALAMTGFCRHLLDTQRHTPLLDRILRWVPAVPAVGMLSLIFTDGTYADGLAALAQIVALFVILLAAIVLSRRGDRLARLFLVAWSMYLVTGIVYSMRYFGLTPYTNLTEYHLQVASALEVVLLSFTLGYRIRLIDAERERAKQESNELRLGREIEIQRERARGLTRLMEQQDRDRRRVARDLHDGLGQLLVVLKGVLAGESSSAAERARDLVARGIDEARALSHGLHPDRLDRLGLTAALKGLVDDLPEQPELTLDAEIRDVDGVLDRSAELHVYRIAQEAINNAFVHGNARNLFVSVEVVGRELLLLVENDGRRFDEPKSDTASPGLGLTGIKERCAALSATLSLEGLEEGGTRLEVSVPLREGSGVRESAEAATV
ncbi:MAG: hypothetical protein H6718_29875 [Polyangiaceae bacterium]|nr:hypothetical protein [Myxococcales bacterium]MCB9589660.1 hypothetical protein [Polyangiaceae bacterium]